MKPIDQWLGGKVTVTRRSDDWHACITGEPEYWECGETQVEAVGNLLRTHGERLEVLPFKRRHEMKPIDQYPTPQVDAATVRATETVFDYTSTKFKLMVPAGLARTLEQQNAALKDAIRELCTLWDDDRQHVTGSWSCQSEQWSRDEFDARENARAVLAATEKL